MVMENHLNPYQLPAAYLAYQ